VFVALGIQHEIRMRRIALPYVACLSLQHFPHFLTHRIKLGGKKKIIEYKICVIIFSITPSDIFLNLRRIQKGFTKNLHTSSCKVPVIFVSFN
jgi:hypothetical protein